MHKKMAIYTVSALLAGVYSQAFKNEGAVQKFQRELISGGSPSIKGKATTWTSCWPSLSESLFYKFEFVRN